MLVLTRRAGESIMIDNEIELKVLKIRGSQVHLGIDAPKKSAVHRKGSVAAYSRRTSSGGCRRFRNQSATA